MSAATTAAQPDAAACSMADLECAVVVPAVAARVAAVCDMIEEHRRGAGTAISGRRAAAISAMIDDVAATAAEGTPRAGRRRRRMASAGGYKQEGRRMPQGEPHHGVVVRARHRGTGQAVAVKSLGRRRSGGSYVGDVLREACLTAACAGHPSLVGFRTVARRAGTGDYSVVTEFVGPSLRAVVADRGDEGRPFQEADVRRMMRQLLAGAEAMHGRGVVHRDIKPDNILVGDGGGGVKIGNFGLAKSVAEKKGPPSSSVAGTMAYMAPEVLARATDQGTPVDAWSLGCVMAELLTGEAPFQGKDEANQLFKIYNVLGAPSRREWEALKPQAHGDEVKVWRERQLRARHRSRLREMFPGETLSTDGFQVLRGLLTCDPAKRMTAAAALRCPWFTQSVDEDAATVSSGFAAVVTKSCSLAMSLVGHVLGLVRPKTLVH